MRGGSVADNRARVRQAALDLVPDLSARASEAELLRTMPDDLVARVRAGGLFRMPLPASLGGLELDPVTTMEVIETLSEADGSAGWTVLIGNSTAFFAWLDPSVAKEMIGDDLGFCSTSMFAPLGRAHDSGGGALSVSGRWPFNSGCPHADWLQVGVLVMGEEGPRLRDGGTEPDWKFAFVRRESALIEDTWDALGLRGTGSHHLSLDQVRVPAEHFTAPVYERARGDGPLSFLGLFDVASMMMAAFPLGVARRAVDEFTVLARSKFRGNPANTVAGNGHSQMLLSQAESRLRSAGSTSTMSRVRSGTRAVPGTGHHPRCGPSWRWPPVTR